MCCEIYQLMRWKTMHFFFCHSKWQYNSCWHCNTTNAMPNVFIGNWVIYYWNCSFQHFAVLKNAPKMPLETFWPVKPIVILIVKNILTFGDEDVYKVDGMKSKFQLLLCHMGSLFILKNVCKMNDLALLSKKYLKLGNTAVRSMERDWGSWLWTLCFKGLQKL